jgi:hypothetical protein
MGEVNGREKAPTFIFERPFLHQSKLASGPGMT